MSNSQQLQDPTSHKFYEFLTLGLFLGILIWEIWTYFYFKITFIQSITLLFESKVRLSVPLFIMSLITGCLLSAYYFKHLVSNTSKNQHHRGSKFED